MEKKVIMENLMQTDFQRDADRRIFSFSSILFSGGRGGDAIYNYYVYGLQGRHWADVFKDKFLQVELKEDLLSNLKNNLRRWKWC